MIEIEEKQKEKKKGFFYYMDDDVKLFIRAFKVILFIAVIILTGTLISALFASGNIQTSAAGSDVNYSFNQDEFMNSSFSEAPESNLTGPFYGWNTRLQRYTTEHYNASYSFENDVGGYPSGWSSAAGGGSIQVVESRVDINGSSHSAVLEFNDTSSGYVYSRKNFPDDIYFGTIEFWFLSNDTTKLIQIYGKGGFDIAFHLEVDNSKFQYFDGFSHDITDAVNNVWYHVSINYETTINGYAGLSQYDWNIFINGVKYGDYNMWDNTYLDQFYFGSINPDIDYSFYIDAFGFTEMVESPAICLPTSYNIASGIVQNDLNNTWELDGNDWEIVSQDLGGVHAIDFEIDGLDISPYEQPTLTVSYDILITGNPGSETMSLAVEDNPGSWNTTTGLWLYDINESVGSISDIADEPFEISILEFGQPQFTMYIDILRFDYINYTIGGDYIVGDNIKPYIFYYDTYEVETWDFWWNKNSPQTKLLTGTDYFNGWSEIEDGGDGVNCLQSSIIEILEPAVDTIGLEKTDFDINENNDTRLEILFGFNMKSISGTLNNYVDFKIFSNDSTEILTIYWEGDGNELGYYDGSRNVLESGLTEDYWYYLYLDINYITDICYVELGNYTYNPYDYWEVNEIQDTAFSDYIVPLRVADKHGLAEIEILAYADTGTTQFWLDYIGVYVDELSISDEHGRFGIDILSIGEHSYDPDPDMWFYYDYWDFDLNPMVEYIISGEDVSIYLWKSIYLPTLPPTPQITPIVATKDYDGTEQYFNVADFIFDPGERNQQYVYGGVMWFMFWNNFSFTYLDIYGITLSDDDGGGPWTPDYNSGSIDTDDSRMWVEGGNFHFSMTTDDANTEFLEIDFKLYDDYWQYGNPQFTINRSLRWGGRLDTPYLFADFEIDYAYSDYNSYPLSQTYQWRNELLTQTKTVISFGLLVSDNDNDISTTVHGYINPPVLFWYPGAGLDITITNYINIIPGIALISVITITIWIATKKKVGSMLVVPSIAGTAFLSYIAEFIPVWLLFVILLSSGALMYSRWKDLFLIFASFGVMISGFLHYGGVIDLWIFYMFFMLMIGYVIFVGVKDIKAGGMREE